MIARLKSVLRKSPFVLVSVLFYWASVICVALVIQPVLRQQPSSFDEILKKSLLKDQQMKHLTLAYSELRNKSTNPDTQQRNNDSGIQQQATKKPRNLTKAEILELQKTYYRPGTDVKYPYRHSIIKSPRRPCDDDTFMVVLVHSFHPYQDRRRAIRDTWGGVAAGRHVWPGKNITQKLKFMFVLGLHDDHAMERQIQNESETYDDILQGDFVDSYHNMTLKSLLGLKYVANFCPVTKYLLKTDDDMILNIPYLLNILEKPLLSRSVMGPYNEHARVRKTGKWTVNKQVFPFDEYPPYESGAAYVITTDIVWELFVAAQYVRPFFIDDVYITGVLGKILKVSHVQQKGFANGYHMAPDVCDIVKNWWVSGTRMTPEKLLKLWSNLKNNPKCPLKRPPPRKTVIKQKLHQH